MNDGFSQVKEYFSCDFSHFLMGNFKTWGHYKVVEVISWREVSSASINYDELHLIILIGLFEQIGEFTVHVESEGIVPFGAIEGYP